MTKFDLTTATNERVSMTQYKPPAADEKYIRDAVGYLVMKAPFWAHLLYNEMQIVYTHDVPIAATDGYHIFLNIDSMKQLKFDIANVAFVIGHEVSHGFLGDLILMVRFNQDQFVITPKGKLPYDAQIMNMAEDYRINAMLIEGKVGKMPPVGLYDKNLSEKGMESGVEIYAKIWQQNKGGGGRGQPGPGGKPGPGGGFDIHLQPGQKAKDADASGQRAQAIAAAAQAAMASGQGNLPACIQRLLGDILDPKVPWQEFLRSTMLRKAGDPTYDWRFLDKRLLVRPDPMYFARQAHTGCGLIVVAGDTSGSITNPMINTFFGEMGGIVADLNPSELVVMWCDAAVHRVDELEEPEDLLEYHSVIKNEGAGGGGGTDFRPVFQKIDEMGLVPDMVVYFTDTYGTFPDHEPEYPVVWASIVNSPKVPWGDVVEIEL